MNFRILFLFLLLSNTSFEQDYEWSKLFLGDNTDQITRVITDPSDGSIYITGFFFGNLDTDPGPTLDTLYSVDEADMFVIKLDANGQLVWKNQIGGTGTDDGKALAFDANGDLLLLMQNGNSQDLERFDSNNGYPYFLHSTINLFGTSYPKDLAVDSQNNIYLVGSFSDTVDFDNSGMDVAYATGEEDAYLVKLDSSGGYQWLKQIGGSFPAITSIERIFINENDEIFVAGKWLGTVDFDPGAGNLNMSSNGFSEDLFLSKFNQQGDLVWSRHFTGAGFDDLFDMSVAPNNNIYLSGLITNELDFDPTAADYTVNANSFGDAFVLCLNDSGYFNWVHTFGVSGFNMAEGVTCDQYSNIYVTGNFEGNLDFNPGTGTAYADAGSLDDGFILKLDADGYFSWLGHISSPTGFNTGVDIDIDNSNNIIVAGNFLQSSDFDPTDSGTDFQAPQDSYDAFVIKLSQPGLSIMKNELNQLTVFPNPSDGLLKLSELEFSTIEIYNMTGQRVYQLQQHTAKVLDLRHLESGAYIIRAEHNGQQFESTILIR